MMQAEAGCGLPKGSASEHGCLPGALDRGVSVLDALEKVGAIAVGLATITGAVFAAIQVF